MPKIFISYRRDDSKFATTAIYDKLCEPFGQDQIFMDVDGLLKGRDFREELTKAVQRCDLVLAVVGDKWISAEDQGGRRLDNPSDFVRLELEAALARDIPLIPLLVDEATMPQPDELPESLQPFSFRNAAVIRSGRDFVRDLETLVADIQRTVGEEPAVADHAGGAAEQTAANQAAARGGAAEAAPAAASGKKRNRLLVYGGAGLAAAAVIGALAILGGEKGENGPVEEPAEVPGLGGPITLRIMGLRIQPTPEEVEIQQGNGSILSTQAGQRNGVYELPVDRNLQNGYNWPLIVNARRTGYEASEPIYVANEGLEVFPASATLDVNESHQLVPARELEIKARFGDNEVSLTPAQVSVEGGEVSLTDKGTLKIRGSVDQDYPLTVTAKVPGFQATSATLTSEEPVSLLTLDVNQSESQLILQIPEAGLDFMQLLFEPTPDESPSALQRQLLGVQVPIPLTVEPDGPARATVPYGTYEIKIADGVFKGGTLGVLSLDSESSTLALPGPVAGVYFKADGLFDLFDLVEQKLASQPCDVVVWLTADDPGPRFVAFIRDRSGPVLSSLGAPLELIGYDPSDEKWTFQVDWEEAVARHEKIPNRDERFLEHVDQMRPPELTALTVKQTPSGIQCEFSQTGKEEYTSVWRCDSIAPDREAALKYFSANPLFDPGSSATKIPVSHLTVERWLGPAP